MEATPTRPLMIILGLMLATSLAASRVGEPYLVQETGVMRPLPRRVARWTGHALLYCANPDCAEAYGSDEFDEGVEPACPLCGSELDSMAPVERRLLPAGTEVLRSLYRTPGGASSFFVSVVTGGRDRLSLHRPENCLPGQGLAIRGSRLLETPLEDGRTLRTRLLDVRRRIGGSDTAVTSHFTYWYVAPGRETPSQWRLYGWIAADRLLYGRMDRWSYIAIAHDYEPSRERESLAELREFIAALRPLVVRDGPDGWLRPR